MKISVIIPTWNEADGLGSKLEDVRRLKPDEIIVADGGSTDPTARVAGAYQRVTVVASGKGRARQMNAGALAAKGDVLIFLHADTILPSKAMDLVRDTIRGGAIGGRFRVRFDDPSVKYRLLSFFTRYPFFSYGDQAFFTTREVT